MASTKAWDGPLGPVRRRLGRKEAAVFAATQHPMKLEDRRRPEHDGRAEHAGRAHEQRTHAGEDPVRRAEVGRPVS